MSKSVKINCSNIGQSRLFPIGVSLMEMSEILQEEKGLDFEPIAALVNHKSENLNTELYHPALVEFIDIRHAEGMRVYTRTLSFLIAAAVNELYPGSRFCIEHSVSNGFFCHLYLGKTLENSDLEAIKQRVKSFVEANIPILKIEDETADVLEIFRSKGRQDLVKLLSHYGHLYTHYIKMGEHLDHYSGPLAASTKYIRTFDLSLYPDAENGCLLRLPNPEKPEELKPYVEQPKMFGIFKEFVHWNEVLGQSTIGDINESCAKGEAEALIKVSEALQEKRVSQIVDNMLSQPQRKRIILVSGPSSSGKTTFSKRLSVQLAVMGIKPLAISLDDYFLERHQTPRDEKGDYDYESLYALDLELFNQQLNDLLQGKEVIVPRYNFASGQKEFLEERKIHLEENQVLILEGIHALNPELLPSVPQEVLYKIYVSALTSISLDDHNRIATTDNRLIRRMIRDAQYRGTPARSTIARWKSVRAGEDKWIFPYQENADVFFNSAMAFELLVLKRYAEPSLRTVPQNCPEYAEAERLLRFLDYIATIPDNDIPPTSLLREFVGGSSFNY
ncbi:MAG: Flp pilus assembly complex ATPase component TadA [Bacteroidales bacterium]|nr:Flp pilus assembly complex ATPase component TadA [Bacteroidales bacterium]